MRCQVEKKASKTFEDDVNFLKKYSDVVILQSTDKKAQVAVVPAQQGRVMTSTATGSKGLSFGWINRSLIRSGENNKHMNAFGGEDRFWLGPEGGQFSLFFKSGDPFDLEHWWTPPPVNEGAYKIVEKSDNFITFSKKMQLVNYSNFTFDVELSRKIQLLDADKIKERFSVDLSPTLNCVAFESQNTITNIGTESWQKETGLLSIWILGMYNPSPATTIFVPFKDGTTEELGVKVNDSYFGKVPSDRLVVNENILFFKGDGKYRSKIGISPFRAKKSLGSYDADNKVLTLVTFNKPEDKFDYVNSMWELQEQPYAGDAVNSYNDGPPEPGAEPMGPFYELETSSPAAELKPGDSLQHVHTTVHISGTEEKLDDIVKTIFGTDISEIKDAF